MYTIYAIKSEKDGRIYVGFSANLDRRLNEHNRGYVRSTKPFIPWVLIYSEVAESRLEARKREKDLKSGFGKEFLKNLENFPR